MDDLESISTEVAEDITEDGKHSEALKNQRDHIDRLEAQNREKDETIDRLTNGVVFDKAGFPIGETGPGLLMSNMWPENREVTVDSVKEFAELNGLVVTQKAPTDTAAESRLAEVQASSVSAETDDSTEDAIAKALETGDMKAYIALQTASLEPGRK